MLYIKDICFDMSNPVTAESISDDEFLCGNEAVAGAAGTSDTVLRNLKVKPEGEPETRTESVYFCLENNETYNKHVSLKIPPQHVPGTAVGEITVTGRSQVRFPLWYK